MSQEYSLFEEDNHYKISCLAEAPGGFIQSILHTSDRLSFQKTIDAITLLSKDHKVPYWNPLILKDESIRIHKGSDSTGDLFKLKNVLHFIKSVGRETSDLVTGDGGFDYSEDYNSQEINSLPLIYSEIFIALNIQKKGGSFICKLFDVFHSQTRQLLYLLYMSYSEIFFHKPDTSRLSNSEKYIVCKGFRGFQQTISNYMCHNFTTKKLSLKIPEGFMNELEEYNKNYVSQQIHSITMGIHMIEQNMKQTRQSYESQMRLATEWCETYNVPINQRLSSKFIHPIQRYSRWT